MCWNAFPVAYLDPGTGSMVLQFLVGGILGSLLILKIFWRKILGFFTGKKPEPDAEEEQQPPA